MFNNKTILVTGASGGIGSAIAKKLSSAGAALVLVGLNQDELEMLYRQIFLAMKDVKLFFNFASNLIMVSTF